MNLNITSSNGTQTGDVNCYGAFRNPDHSGEESEHVKSFRSVMVETRTLSFLCLRDTSSNTNMTSQCMHILTLSRAIDIHTSQALCPDAFRPIPSPVQAQVDDYHVSNASVAARQSAYQAPMFM